MFEEAEILMVFPQSFSIGRPRIRTRQNRVDGSFRLYRDHERWGASEQEGNPPTRLHEIHQTLWNCPLLSPCPLLSFLDAFQKGGLRDWMLGTRLEGAQSGVETRPKHPVDFVDAGENFPSPNTITRLPATIFTG